jgi:hypothetical protein
MRLRKLVNGTLAEQGQVVVLATAFLVIAVAFAAIVVDAGFFLHDRRDSQNTADAAALAGSQYLPDSPTLAEDTALEWSSRNEWTNGADGVAVTATTPYDGSPNKIEVVVEGPARGVGFFDALMDVSSRAVAARLYGVASCILPWGIVAANENPDDFYGLTPEDRLYKFQDTESNTPGNYGAVSIYGTGADVYKDVIRNICEPVKKERVLAG